VGRLERQGQLHIPSPGTGRDSDSSPWRTILLIKGHDQNLERRLSKTDKILSSPQGKTRVCGGIRNIPRVNLAKHFHYASNPRYRAVSNTSGPEVIRAPKTHIVVRC
jgi:hypothetical protein